MLYSQLYRSILQACRELTRHPHYTGRTNRLIISLPLLISVPSAYGAIVSPQVETAAPVNSTEDNSAQPYAAKAGKAVAVNRASTKGTLPSNVTTVDQVSTLEDSSKLIYRSLPATSTSSATTTTSQTNQTQIVDSDALVEKSKDSSKPKKISSTEAEALLAVGFEQPTKSEVQQQPDGFVVQNSVTYPEDEYIQPTTANNSNKTTNSKSSNGVQAVQKGRSDNSDSHLKAPTNPNRTSAFTSTESSKSGGVNTNQTQTDPSDKNSNRFNSSGSEKATLGQRVDNSRKLADSFKQDSVQKSLQRLSKYYQQQASELRDRIDNQNKAKEDSLGEESNQIEVIEAQKLAPPVSSDILDLQYEATSAPRCEGVWVTPNNTGADAQYQQAIQRAQQQDGLSIAGGLPLHAMADYGYYDNETYVELAGNVEIMQNGKLITADEIALDLDTGIAGAKGEVLLADSGSSVDLNNPNYQSSNNSSNEGVIAVAEELAYSTNDSRATAYDVAFASVPMQAHGYAQKLNKSDEAHYELEKVMFSTCPPTDRKWQLEAQQIDIDTDSGRGEAYDATFRLGNVPVFYLPYFNFPVDDRRSSGLLTPSASIDSESGLKLSVPYYLNLAPDYDATITTDVYTNRNPMINGEFRYLTENYGQGTLNTAYLPNDKEYSDEDRTGVFYSHQWASKDIPRLTADAVYSYVSDPDYLNDFDDYGLVDNKLNLPRRARVNYYDDYIDAQFKVETFQSLEATDAQGNKILDKDKPYSRLPQLTIDYRLPKLNNVLDNFVISGTHDSAYFKKSINDGSENEKSGVRLYNEIYASYPMEKSWGYIKPKVGLQHLYTAFDEESRLDNDISKDDNDQSAFVPSFSVDTGLNFFSTGTPFGWFDNDMGGYQLLSPRLKYTYAPYEDQSAIPNFDTRIASFDYDQLFEDSWFLGHDRIADNNSLAVGLNYRYIDAMGITRFDGGIGDQFFLDKPEVGLEATEGTLDINSTGVAWRTSLQPYRNLWFDVNGALNSDNELSYVTSQIRYNPTPNSLINFGVIDRKRDPITNQSDLSALTAAAIIPINDNWRFMGQGQFDTDSSKFIDATVGIDYEDCCYGFSIYGRSYYNDLNLDDDLTHAIMAEFRINGFGNRKSGLSKHLDEKILGFEPVDNSWKR